MGEVYYIKSTFHMFIVSYNNCYRILHRLPMRCSASGMFAAPNVKAPRSKEIGGESRRRMMRLLQEKGTDVPLFVAI